MASQKWRFSLDSFPERFGQKLSPIFGQIFLVEEWKRLVRRLASFSLHRDFLWFSRFKTFAPSSCSWRISPLVQFFCFLKFDFVKVFLKNKKIQFSSFSIFLARSAALVTGTMKSPAAIQAAGDIYSWVFRTDNTMKPIFDANKISI